MQVGSAEGLRLARGDDWRTLGEVTAEAFAADPVATWTFDGKPCLRPVFQRLARDVYLPRGICHLADGDLGATMWLPPGASKELPGVSLLGAAARLLIDGGPRAMARALAVDAEMARRKPKAPHAYLFTIGVRASARGKGLGRRLLAPVLAACDAAGVPAYLENSNPANTPLYAGAGFRTLDVFSPAPGCPPLAAMWREASA
ncbi:sortase-like acyltransferase [Caulobacter sp. AP07]|uniref:GNAT family N-acetyltransferase n=1 Tax=Caulobacter sp. AP07 TaxID=1144304 RepID=UPI000271E80A|nr:GNAT family N-acetyltransferase [Caulobacter sp. AP07]EJL38392.1 sortase-like acyltransferase [Caulobacter sp. AP07]